ncbi:MAG: hypothetical protein RIC55_00690 [Pirellulaceae bacterium]
MLRFNRRTFLAAAAASPLVSPIAASSLAAEAADSKREKLPVAAVVTVYRRNSHADVLVGKILEGWRQQGGPGPDLKLVSMYVDQTPKGDKSAELAKTHGFRLAKTIDEAITLGTDKVQVAGVISVGEHGDYPYTEDTHQHMYPRRRFFDGIAAAFERCGRVVPVFSDKHLHWRWKDALHMYNTSRRMKIPFMAGSSLPLGWRVPTTLPPHDLEIEDAVAVGYGGAESYAFHAMEMLQSLIERRKGGEKGVAAVSSAAGEGVWRAEREGRWSRKLVEAALAAQPLRAKGTLEEKMSDKAPFYFVDHRDGLKTTVAMVNGVAREFSVALKLKGVDKPVATLFHLEDEPPYGHFAYLLRAIEEMIHTGKPSYPVERTLLVTGMLDAAMHSLADGGKRLATPELGIRYEAGDWPFADHVKLG